MGVDLDSVMLSSISILSSHSSGPAFPVVATDTPYCIGSCLLKLICVLVRVDVQVQLRKELTGISGTKDAHANQVNENWDCNQTSINEYSQRNGRKEN